MTEREEVERLLCGFFKDDWSKIALWMKTPNPLLGGMVPNDLLALRPGKLLKIVKQSLSENKPE